MSAIKTLDDDDFADAARKHRDDAAALLGARRWDGAAYHAGYVVECSLKGLLLVGVIADRVGGLSRVKVAAPGRVKGDAIVLGAIKALRSPSLGHNVAALRATSLGRSPSAVPIASPHIARYVPRPLRAPRTSRLFAGAAAGGWTETLRYRSPGRVSRPDARAWCETASKIYRQSIGKMILDGVL